MSEEKEILFQAFPKQIEFMEACFSGLYKFILYGGAIRGGKTYALIGFFLICCRLFPGSKYLIVRKDLKRIRDTVIPSFNQICPSRFALQEPNQSNGWSFIATNGSEIKFFAENREKDPELKRFRGLEYDSIGFEELDVSKECFLIGLQRCGTWKMSERQKAKESGGRIPPAIAVATSNPQLGWVKKEIYDKHQDGKLNSNWLYIQSRVFDNPYIGQDWIDSQKDNMPLLLYKQMIDGDWSVNLNEKPFFHSFHAEDHVWNGLMNVQKDEVLTLSFDFNVNPATVSIGQKIWGFGCFVIRDQKAEGGTAELLKKLEWIRQGNYILEIVGDNSGHSRNSASEYTDFDLIEEFFGIPAEPITRKANARHIFSRSLCNHLFYKGAILISREGCPNLLLDIMNAQTNKAGGLLKDENNQNHFTDNFRYMINHWFRSINEINEFVQAIQVKAA